MIEMKFDKFSFRVTEGHRLYLQEMAKRRGIDNQTELLRTIVEEHKAQNMDSTFKLEIDVDNSKNARRRPALSQKNKEDSCSSVDTTFQYELLSPARADRDNVDKPSYRTKQRRRQNPLPMQHREDGTYYVDNSRIQANSMWTGNWDNHEPVYNLHPILLYQIMRQQWQQSQQFQAMMLAWQNQVQQARSRPDTLSMSYMPPLGYPMMQSVVPQQASMDSMDILLESMYKAVWLKNYCDLIMKW